MSKHRSARYLGRVHHVLSFIGLALIMGMVFTRLSAGGPVEARTTLALGFLLLASYLGGVIARSVGLPKITGYLLIGLLVGPAMLGLVRADEIQGLRFIGDAAVVLIALAAGGELKLKSLRAEGRLLARMTGAAIVLPGLAVGGVVLLLSAWFPLTAGLPWGDRLAIALLLGVVAAASSPAVAMAVIGETAAQGPVARTILGVTVAKDVTVIVLFALALTVARGLTSVGAVDVPFVLLAIAELLGSMALGVVLGWLIAQYLKFVRRHMAVFVIGVAFVTVEAAVLLHLEPMLIALVAGFFMENVSPVQGTALVNGVERSSLPVYAVFFGLAGAGLHLEALGGIWPWVAALALLRVAGLLGAVRWAARDGPEAVRRFGWLGLVSQAGVTLGLASVLRRAFPAWGVSLETLVVAMIAVHELVGPVLFRLGLTRAGEVREGTMEPAPLPAAP